MDTNILDYQNYVYFLKDYYFKKCESDPEYSISRFATELEIPPSTLNRILNGKRGPSKKNASKICQALFETSSEQEHFYNLVDLSHSESLLNREQARIKVMKVLQDRSQNLGTKQLKALNSWVDFAVRQAAFLFEISPHQDSCKKIETYLGLSKDQVMESLSKLKKLGYLEDIGGRLYPSEPFLYSMSGVDFEAGRKANRELFELALEKYEKTSAKDRYYTNTLMNIDPDKMPLAQEKLENFRKEFNREMTQELDNKKGVYCLGIQFYELGSR
ncbi:MAG: TIGR02147 family protein [Halobacteriovoraceae bacterium]|nr:TIGR02147 family protein [Halobacteriovoraceae bacterium]